MQTYSSILVWKIPWTEGPWWVTSMAEQSCTQLKWLSTYTHRHIWRPTRVNFILGPGEGNFQKPQNWATRGITDSVTDKKLSLEYSSSWKHQNNCCPGSAPYIHGHCNCEKRIFVCIHILCSPLHFHLLNVMYNTHHVLEHCMHLFKSRCSGLPWRLSGKESACQCRGHGVSP